MTEALAQAVLRATIDRADTYALTMLASAIAFTVLCFPQPVAAQSDQSIRWTLLGFPLNFHPALALVVLYCIFVVSSLLTDNMLLHVRDIAQRIKAPVLVADLLMHPSVLTVSPIGAFLATTLPSLLVLLGLWRLWSQGQYALPAWAWFLLAGFAMVGFVVYLRVVTILWPLQSPSGTGT